MKKLFTLAIIFILAGITLSSCHSSSVMKRRYNKGYYVHHKAKPTEPKVCEAVADTKIKEPLLTAQKKSEQATVIHNTDVVTSQPLAAAVIKNEAENKQDLVIKSNNKGLLKSIPPQYSIKQPFKALRNVSTDLSKSGHAEGDALSLLWILIVVLLVLYLVGLLTGEFGVGGLIHVLAVIILVLLILWLLRIL